MESIQSINNRNKMINTRINTKGSKIDFKDKLNELKGTNPKEKLEKLFGLKVDVRAIRKDNKSVLESIKGGLAPITIAPNILKKMEHDKALKERVIGSIDRHIKSEPAGREFLRARGRRLIATGTIVHEDGTITNWVMSDYTPEEKERIRKAQEEEQKAKEEFKERLYGTIEEHDTDEISVDDFYIRLSHENKGLYDSIKNLNVFDSDSVIRFNGKRDFNDGNQYYQELMKLKNLE